MFDFLPVLREYCRTPLAIFGLALVELRNRNVVGPYGHDFRDLWSQSREQIRDLGQGHFDPAEHEEVARNIAAVKLPAADPVSGADGPLVRIWGG